MLFGLHGFKTSGKDAFYQRALVGWELDFIPFKPERVAFADKLYASAAAALGVLVDDLLQWKNDPDAVITLRRKLAVGDEELRSDITFRQYLQYYGTEAHREVFGDEFWVDQVLGDDFDHSDRLVLVTDVRFPNEGQRVRDRGGLNIKILGPPEVEQRTDMHASENPFPDNLIDLIVDNSRRDDDFESLDQQIVAVTNYFVGRPFNPEHLHSNGTGILTATNPIT